MSSIQVLTVTMGMTDPNALLEKMNIRTPFVIGNQCDKDGILNITYKNINGIVVSRNERGVGNNRNIALKYATEDICVLADDDMRFKDDYALIVNKAFRCIPDADVIVFNLGNAGAGRRKNHKIIRLNLTNYMNYGAARIAFKRKTISYNAIYFNTNFGGGTQHCAGEDVLFLNACLKNKLKVYAVPWYIASLTNQRESTWFKGYTDEYLFDKGVFLAVSNPKYAKVFAAYLALRHSEYMEGSRNRLDVFKTICKGVDYIKRKVYLK